MVVDRQPGERDAWHRFESWQLGGGDYQNLLVGCGGRDEGAGDADAVIADGDDGEAAGWNGACGEALRLHGGRGESEAGDGGGLDGDEDVSDFDRQGLGKCQGEIGERKSAIADFDGGVVEDQAEGEEAQRGGGGDEQVVAGAFEEVPGDDGGEDGQRGDDDVCEVAGVEGQAAIKGGDLVFGEEGEGVGEGKFGELAKAGGVLG